MHKARNLFNRYTCSFRMKFIPKSVRHPPPLYCKNWTGQWTQTHRGTFEPIPFRCPKSKSYTIVIIHTAPGNLQISKEAKLHRKSESVWCADTQPILNLYDALILNRFEKSWKNCKNVFPSFFFTFKFFETPTNPGTKWIVVKWKKFWSKVPVWDQATLW